MSREDHGGFAPGEVTADVASGAIGIVVDSLQGTLQATKHAKNIAIAVPNTVIQTAADVTQIGVTHGAQMADTAAHGVNEGLDSVLDHVTELLEQAQHELDEGLHAFGHGLPSIG